jgi:hypothetical protein
MNKTQGQQLYEAHHKYLKLSVCSYWMLDSNAKAFWRNRARTKWGHERLAFYTKLASKPIRYINRPAA